MKTYTSIELNDLAEVLRSSGKIESSIYAAATKELQVRVSTSTLDLEKNYINKEFSDLMARENKDKFIRCLTLHFAAEEGLDLPPQIKAENLFNFLKGKGFLNCYNLPVSGF